MKLKGLAVTVAILAVLAAGAFWANRAPAPPPWVAWPPLWPGAGSGRPAPKEARAPPEDDALINMILT